METTQESNLAKGAVSMHDIKKVINELVEHIESALDVDSDYVDCVRTDLLQTVVGLLKEQDELLHKKQKDIDRLCNEISEWKHKFHDKSLKEQEKAKVVFGRCKDGSFATECGHCGTYLDKAYSICPKCNKELDWNSNQD